MSNYKLSNQVKLLIIEELSDPFAPGKVNDAILVMISGNNTHKNQAAALLIHYRDKKSLKETAAIMKYSKDNVISILRKGIRTIDALTNYSKEINK